MGKEKPDPIVLKLSPLDMQKQGITSLNFTAAHFDNFLPSMKSHKSITCSTGNFVVTWNFSRVIKNLRKPYTILKKSETPVVDAQFRFNTDSQMVVTE
jgi:hypothetical protein